MNLTELPENLPIPTDDGAADHLPAKPLPNIVLPATNGGQVNISHIPGLLVLYIYPMTGRPDTPLPDNWDQIPGARGCTPQSCSFRDHYAELQHHQASVFGLSCQTSDYQREAKTRLHLPFELLSDDLFALQHSLHLPTFSSAGTKLYKRITLIARDGIIEKVFYPVFPPSDNAQQVLAWLHKQGYQHD
ncbi:MAG TPA: peroxiredoxin [Oceanospirillaceae bacterium]|nr:peroxiredoxin [Oceanospirillaceae bacterium]